MRHIGGEFPPSLYVIHNDMYHFWYSEMRINEFVLEEQGFAGVPIMARYLFAFQLELQHFKASCVGGGRDAQGGGGFADALVLFQGQLHVFVLGLLQDMFQGAFLRQALPRFVGDGEILLGNFIGFAHDDDFLQDILELSDVPRPGKTLDQLIGAFSERFRHAVALIEGFQKVYR